jgi:hypothetical protein
MTDEQISAKTQQAVTAVAALGLRDEIATFKAQIRDGVETERRRQLESSIAKSAAQIDAYLPAKLSVGSNVAIERPDTPRCALPSGPTGPHRSRRRQRLAVVGPTRPTAADARRARAHSRSSARASSVQSAVTGSDWPVSITWASL